MYKLLSSLSYIVRFWLAYVTIEKVSIFKSDIINYFWGEVFSIYTLLMIISYFIAGKFYLKNDMSSSIDVIIYFFIYCILLFLTWIRILP